MAFVPCRSSVRKRKPTRWAPGKLGYGQIVNSKRSADFGVAIGRRPDYDAYISHGLPDTSAGGGRCLKAIPVNPSDPMTGETGRNGGSIILRPTIHALTTEDDSTAMDSTYVPAYRWRNRDYQPVDSSVSCRCKSLSFGEHQCKPIKS